MAEETTLAVVDGQKNGLPTLTFNQKEVELVRATVARGTTDEEFALFLYVAKHTGLNPLLRQIHAVKRWDSKLNREAMAIQVGVDGYRLIAERTKKYVPGPQPEFTYTQDGTLLSATAHVKKYVEGEWHTVSATAFYSEYAQLTKEGKPNSMWARGGHFMLAKCAETLAIRKAFPNETAGTQGEDEMMQADNPAETRPPIQQPKPKAAPESQEKPEANYKTIVVERIETRDVKKKDGSGTFEALTVHAKDGWKGELPGFLPAAAVLRDAEQAGASVRVGFAAERFGNKIGSAELAQEAGDAQEPAE